MKTNPPEDLSAEEIRSIRRWVDRSIAEGRLPDRYGAKGVLRDLLDQCLDWHRANGVRRADWCATFRNWIRKDYAMRRERYEREHPQEAGRRGASMEKTSQNLFNLDEFRNRS